MNGFSIEYVELPNGRIPARDFIDSLDDKAVARAERLRKLWLQYRNRYPASRKERQAIEKESEQ